MPVSASPPRFAERPARPALQLLLAWALAGMVALAPSPALASDLLELHSVAAFTQGDVPSAFDASRRRLVVIGRIADDSGPLVEVLDVSGPPIWRRPATVGAAPPSGLFGAAIYDSLRDRIVVLTAGSAWSLSLAEPMTWTHLNPSGTAPILNGTCIVYDSVRDRIIGHGGIPMPSQINPRPSSVNDTWTLSLGAVPAWSTLATAGGSPPTRARAAAIYDPVQDRMLVFGGYTAETSTTDRNDTWELSFIGGIPAWNPLSTTGVPPPPRNSVAAILDRADRRLVVTGGQSNGSPQAGTWQLDLAGAAWLAIDSPSASPGPRYGSAAAYDAAAARMIAAGGARNSYPYLLGDSWALALGPVAGPWSELLATGAPATALQFAGYDPWRHRFAGIQDGAPWFLSVIDSVWQPVGFVGPPPGPTLDQFYDGRTNTLWAFSLDALYRIQPGPGAAWSRYTIPAPAPPAFDVPGTNFLDARRGRILMIGGQSLSIYTPGTAEFWILSLSSTPAWTKVSDSTPLGVRMTPAIEDTRRDRLIFFGGAHLNHALPPDLFGDLNTLDLATLQWTIPAATGIAPAPRYNFAAAYDSLRDRAIVFGGIQAGNVQSGVHDLQFAPADANGNWTRNDPVGVAVPNDIPVPGAVDPGLDRFFVGGGASYYELEWDAGASALSVECPPATPWTAGAIVTRTFRVTQLVNAPHSYEWTVSSRRNWPGLPLQGFLDIPFATTASLPIGIPVPDSAAGGANTLEFVITDLANSGLRDSCVSDLTAPVTAPVIVDASCPAAVSWVPGGTAQGHFSIAVTGTASTSLDYWLTSARAWPGFPVTGTTPLVGGAGALDLAVSVPDTATTGTNTLTATFRPAGESVSDSCSWTLTGPGTSPAPGPEYAVAISPNPAPGPLTLRLGLQHDTTVRVEIRQLVTGRLVLAHSYGRLTAGTYAFELVSGETLPIGVYLVRTFVDGFTRDAKLIVVR